MRWLFLTEKNVTLREKLSKEFGRFVKENRVRSGLTQPELCDKLSRQGYRTKTDVLSRYESGRMLPGLVKSKVIAGYIAKDGLPKEMVDMFKRLEDPKRMMKKTNNGSRKSRRTTFVFDEKTRSMIDAIKKANGIISDAHAVRFAIRRTGKSLPKLSFPVDAISRHSEGREGRASNPMMIEPEDDEALARIITKYSLGNRSEAMRLAVRVAAEIK